MNRYERQSESLKQYWENRTSKEMEEWSKKFSGENHHYFGKNRDDETKEKISKSNSVAILFDGIKYDSFRIASEKLNMTERVMTRILKKEVENGNPNYKIFYKDASKVLGKKNPDKQKRILFAGIEYESLTECGKSLNKSPERIGQILREQIKKGNVDYKYL